MNDVLLKTDFTLPGQTDFYRGKVRDVYTINEDLLVMVSSDRLSAFDVVLPKGIPYKGQVLNCIAMNALEATNDIVPNWFVSSPHPNVSVGRKATPFPVEMVIRGYMCGHAWREYAAGRRHVCGEPLPEDLNENDQFPEPIITPTTKAHEGHDEDISAQEIIAQGLVSEEDYEQLAKYTKALFVRGSERAKERGLILVDTKYEFGKTASGEIVLIDEIHTPDSSRFFYLEGYEELQKAGKPQRQLSKEFVRKWLIEHDFSGKDGQVIPDMPDDFIETISERYIELYDQLTIKSFVPESVNLSNIEAAIKAALDKLK